MGSPTHIKMKAAVIIIIYAQVSLSPEAQKSTAKRGLSIVFFPSDLGRFCRALSTMPTGMIPHPS